MKKRIICAFTLVCLILAMFTATASAETGTVSKYCTQCGIARPHTFTKSFYTFTYYKHTYSYVFTCNVTEYWFQLTYKCNACGKTSSNIYKLGEDHDSCGKGLIKY